MAEQKKSVGALWCRKSKGGVNYYSGMLELNEGEKIAIVAFKNTKKQDKQPDWRIYLSEPPAGTSAPAGGSAPAPKGKAKAKSAPAASAGAEAGDGTDGANDDIPF